MAVEAVEAEPNRDEILTFTSRVPVTMQSENNDRTWWGYGRQVEKAMQEAEKKGYFVAGVIGVDPSTFKSLWWYQRTQLLRFHGLQRVIQVAQGVPPYDVGYHKGLTNENVIDITPDASSYYYDTDGLKAQRKVLMAKQMKYYRELSAKHRKDIRDLDAGMTFEYKKVLTTKGRTRYRSQEVALDWYLVLMRRK
jgi:hypothetical protein